MTVFLTIFSGVLTFVLGQLTLKLVIDPVQEFKKTIADIAFALIEYANVYANPGYADSETLKKASIDFRKLSSRLNSQMQLVPFYRLTTGIFGLPSKAKVFGSSMNLIGLSNGVFVTIENSPLIINKNLSMADEIRTSLNIFKPLEENIPRP